jgi:methyl-accepting chemotaxis protein/hemerythrin
MKWDNGHSVGIEEFDGHHQKLFAIIGGLVASSETGADDEAAVVRALTELLDYTNYHFKAEEDALRKHGYPGLSRQEAEHRDFIATLNVFKASYDYGVVPPVGDLVEFLKKWLTNHIMVCDKEYSAFLAKKGVR